MRQIVGFCLRVVGLVLVIGRTEGILSCVQGNSKMMKLGPDRCIAKVSSQLALA